jgi:membrane-associated phospholipid phosphatase
MYQGGHFLSDVIFGAIFSMGTALALHWLMFRADGRPRGPAGRDWVPPRAEAPGKLAL